MRSRIARFRNLMLLLGDIGCLVVGLLLALALRYGYPIPSDKLELHRIPFTIIFVVWLMSFFVVGLYSLRAAKNNRRFFTLLFTTFIGNAAIAVIFFYFIPYFAITPKTVLFLDLGITLLLLLGWRAFFNSFISLPPLRFAMIGSGQEVDELLHDLERHPQQGYKCVHHFENADPIENLNEFLKKEEIDVVVVAVDYRKAPQLQKALFECIPLQIRFYDFVDFYEQQRQKIPLAVIDRAWFLENLNEPGKQVFSTVKKAVDLAATFMLGIIGVLLSPFIALAILIESGRPIFYSQIRAGKLGKPFRIYKFRSMRRDGDDATVTRVGGLLRRTHTDEIPQLWNVLKGEMSFVGPRPEQLRLVDELKQKIPFYTERLLVAPGITGWAQLHEPEAKAEDALSKLQYDLFYVKHRSLLLDLEIILKTLRILIL